MADEVALQPPDMSHLPEQERSYQTLLWWCATKLKKQIELARRQGRLTVQHQKPRITRKRKTTGLKAEKAVAGGVVSVSTLQQRLFSQVTNSDALTEQSADSDTDMAGSDIFEDDDVQEVGDGQSATDSDNDMADSDIDDDDVQDFSDEQPATDSDDMVDSEDHEDENAQASTINRSAADSINSPDSQNYEHDTGAEDKEIQKLGSEKLPQITFVQNRGIETIENWYRDGYERDDPNGLAPEAVRRHNLMRAMAKQGFAQHRAQEIVWWLMRCKGRYRNYNNGRAKFKLKGEGEEIYGGEGEQSQQVSFREELYSNKHVKEFDLPEGEIAADNVFDWDDIFDIEQDEETSDMDLDDLDFGGGHTDEQEYDDSIYGFAPPQLSSTLAASSQDHCDHNNSIQTSARPTNEEMDKIMDVLVPVTPEKAKAKVAAPPSSIVTSTTPTLSSFSTVTTRRSFISTRTSSPTKPTTTINPTKFKPKDKHYKHSRKPASQWIQTGPTSWESKPIPLPESEQAHVQDIYYENLLRRHRMFEIIFGPDCLPPDDPSIQFDYTKGPFPRAIPKNRAVQRRTQNRLPVVQVKVPSNTSTSASTSRVVDAETCDAEREDNAVLVDTEDPTNGFTIIDPKDRLTPAEMALYTEQARRQRENKNKVEVEKSWEAEIKAYNTGVKDFGAVGREVWKELKKAKGQSWK